MNAYVHDQTLINERRVKEMEEQVKAANLAAAAVTTVNEPTLVSEPMLVTEPTITLDVAENQTQSVAT